MYASAPPTTKGSRAPLSWYRRTAITSAPKISQTKRLILNDEGATRVYKADDCLPALPDSEKLLLGMNDYFTPVSMAVALSDHAIVVCKRHVDLSALIRRHRLQGYGPAALGYTVRYTTR